MATALKAKSQATCCIYIHSENDGVCPNRNRNWTTHGIRWEISVRKSVCDVFNFLSKDLKLGRFHTKCLIKLCDVSIGAETRSAIYIPNDYSCTFARSCGILSVLFSLQKFSRRQTFEMNGTEGKKHDWFYGPDVTISGVLRIHIA